MPLAKAITFPTDGWIDTNTTFRAYIQDDATGLNIDPTLVSAIDYTVTEALGAQQGTVTADAVNLTPVATYLTIGLSMTGWFFDRIGYNFQATLPADCFPDAGDYVVDLVFTLASDGSTFPVKCFHHARSRS